MWGTIKSTGGIKWQIVIVNGVGKNILIPERCLSIHVGKTRKGVNTPYMKAAKRRNIFVSIAGGSLAI
jgi:hypothetical protein